MSNVNIKNNDKITEQKYVTKELCNIFNENINKTLEITAENIKKLAEEQKAFQNSLYELRNYAMQTQASLNTFIETTNLRNKQIVNRIENIEQSDQHQQQKLDSIHEKIERVSNRWSGVYQALIIFGLVLTILINLFRVDQWFNDNTKTSDKTNIESSYTMQLVENNVNESVINKVLY